MSLSLEVVNAFSLKDHANLCERWRQDRIVDDPSILGLGDVDLVTVEKVQPSAGRLDLLLQDEQLNRRYEVELMLGATDPSHIIRTIEYWDIERRRYPAYEHVAVIVAEDITTRFLNVMSLFSGSIPLVAIQVAALQIEDRVILHFVKVLNQTELRTDDAYEGNTEGSESDRSTWEDKVGGDIMSVCDAIVTVGNEVASSPLQLKYKKHRVSVAVAGSFFNVCVLRPKQQFVNLVAGVSDREEAT